MKLASLLNRDLIFPELEGNDRASLYAELLKKMSRVMQLPLKPEILAKGMIEREDSYKISYDMGIAFPHVRHPKLNDLDIGIGLLKTPCRLKENDKADSQIVLCCLISENTSVIYLKALAALSKFVLANPEGAKKLMSARSADEFIRLADEFKIEVKHTLCAEDVMKRDLKTVSPDDNLGAALDVLSEERVPSVPVVDESGKFCGVIHAREIIKRAIPEYILMLGNTNFLKQFEPFETLLKEESKMFVRDVMYPPRDENMIKPETPLIQLTVHLLKSGNPALMVVDDTRKLHGVVTYTELVNNVLRG